MNREDRDIPQGDLERHKLNLETAPIAWVELQRHFASGRLIAVSTELDLVDVAYRFAIDDKGVLAQWLDCGMVHPVRDEQAKEWHAGDAWLWAVVVKPWVLVQEQTARG